MKVHISSSLISSIHQQTLPPPPVPTYTSTDLSVIMKEEDYINMMDTINAIMGHDGDQDNDPGVRKLASFHIDYPDAEMSMKLEDITCPAKLEGPISYEYLIEKYEIAVWRLERYLRKIDVLVCHLSRQRKVVTFATEKGSVTEFIEKLSKEELHVKKLIDAIHGVLLNAKEQTDEKAVIESMAEMSLDKAT